MQNTRRYVLIGSPARKEGVEGERNQADSKNKIDPIQLLPSPSSLARARATVGFSFHSTCSTVQLFRPLRISPSSFSSSLSLLFSSSQPSNLTPLDVWERKDSLEETPYPANFTPGTPKRLLTTPKKKGRELFSSLFTDNPFLDLFLFRPPAKKEI
jgi:hypothetical protein